MKGNEPGSETGNETGSENRKRNRKCLLTMVAKRIARKMVIDVNRDIVKSGLLLKHDIKFFLNEFLMLW